MNQKKILTVAVIMLLIGVGIGYSSAPTKTIIDRTSAPTETYTTTVTIMKTIKSTITETASPEIPVEIPQSETGEWITLISFEGKEDRNTEKFHVPRDYWRIKYTVESNNPYAVFYCYVEPLVFVGVDAHESTSDISYIYDGPGDYHLVINCANLDSWNVEIQIQE